MAIETSNKKKGIKTGWRNKLKKLPEKKEMACIKENSEFDLDDSFSSDGSQGDALAVGPCTREGAAAEFRWSLEADEGIISRSPSQQKTLKNNRFSTFGDEELYLSDEFNIADEINFENEVARDASTSNSSIRKSSTTSKLKKNKKKKQKSSGSTEKRSSSKSTSTKKTGGSSSKGSKTKPRGSSKSLSCTSKETSKKDKTKKKKKKSLRQSTDVDSCSDNSKRKSAKPSGETRTLLEDSVEEPPTSSDLSSKPPRKVSLLDQAAETDSFAETEETEASTEGDDQFETPPPIIGEMDGCNENDNHKLLSPTPSVRNSILKNKIRSSLMASLGEQSPLRMECSARSSEVSRGSQLRSPRPSDRHSTFKNKIRASLASLGERSAMSALMIECGSARSSEVSRNSNRSSQNSADQAFLDAFQSEDRESVLGRLSVQDKDMMENLLNELQQYESQLEEERSEISKERCMMQLKQEAVEQMLEVEMDKNSRLEYQLLDLQERLDHYEKAKEDNELVQTIKMLKAEVELLRQKTERQDQTMANMALKAKRNQESHRDSSSVSISNLPGKEQGELLMLRSAFEEQAKELAKMKEQIRSTKEDHTVQELKKAVKNAEQQKKYFMKETQRLKKLLGKQSNQSSKKKSKGWFGSMSDNDECLLDVGDTSMVFGSVSDIGDCAVVPENDDVSSSWMNNSSIWMAMNSESLQEESSSSWMGMSSDDSLQTDSCY